MARTANAPQTYDLKPGTPFKDGDVRFELKEPVPGKKGKWNVTRFAFSTGFKKSVGPVTIEMPESRIQQLLIAHYGDTAARDIATQGTGSINQRQFTGRGRTQSTARLAQVAPKKTLHARIQQWLHENQSQQPTPSA